MCARIMKQRDSPIEIENMVVTSRMLKENKTLTNGKLAARPCRLLWVSTITHRVHIIVYGGRWPSVLWLMWAYPNCSSMMSGVIARKPFSNNSRIKSVVISSWDGFLLCTSRASFDRFRGNFMQSNIVIELLSLTHCFAFIRRSSSAKHFINW